MNCSPWSGFDGVFGFAACSREMDVCDIGSRTRCDREVHNLHTLSLTTDMHAYRDCRHNVSKLGLLCVRIDMICGHPSLDRQNIAQALVGVEARAEAKNVRL